MSELIPDLRRAAARVAVVALVAYAASGVAVQGRAAARGASSQRATGPRMVRVVVAQDGSGDFPTIQRAIDHAPNYGSARLIIAIKPGIYRERLMVPQERPRVTFLGLGADAADTVITAAMSAREAGGTFLSSTVEVEAAGFEAENLTFQNTFGAGSQAVAISVHSDGAIFRRCRFIGWQDTLYAARGRQYYLNCYIEGAVDFIFGDAAAVFDHCEIKSVGRGYVAAVNRTAADEPTGFVFDHCRLTSANLGPGVYLGRPWRPYARTVFLHCWMDSHILPAGWDDWRDPANEKTAYFAEYDSSGPGGAAAKRVPWSHQLTATQAARFAASAFLRGADDWHPEKSVPGARR